MRADQRGQNLLFFLRKSRHVGMLEQIGAVLLVMRVRHVQTDLVQLRGPAQHRFREGIVQRPFGLGLAQEVQCRRLHSRGLRQIDVIAPLHGAHAAHARILVGEAPDQVIKQAFAQRPFGGLHRLDVEHGENLRQDRHAARKHRQALLGEPGQSHPGQLAGAQHLFDQVFDDGGRDRSIAIAPRAQDVAEAEQEGKPHALLLQVQVSTHHSFAMYDQTKVVTAASVSSLTRRLVPAASVQSLTTPASRARR